MAKIYIGKVKKVFGSGRVETDKNIRANIKAEIGTPLEFDDVERKVYIKEPKVDENTIPTIEYDGLSVDELKEKFNKTQLKQICKQKELKGYSKLDETELANLIVFGRKEGEEKTGNDENKDGDE